MVVDVTGLMESSNVITDRKSEFKKVISLLRQVIKEAKKRYGSDIMIAVMDEAYYQDLIKHWCDSYYEDFMDGFSDEILICSVDCYKGDKDYDDRSNDAHYFIISAMKNIVRKSPDISGRIDSDGYKHDCQVLYTSAIEV